MAETKNNFYAGKIVPFENLRVFLLERSSGKQETATPYNHGQQIAYGRNSKY
jgi:hypothetical protein